MPNYSTNYDKLGTSLTSDVPNYSELGTSLTSDVPNYSKFNKLNKLIGKNCAYVKTIKSNGKKTQGPNNISMYCKVLLTAIIMETFK